MKQSEPLRLHGKENFLYPHMSFSFNWSNNDVEKHRHSFYEFFVITNGEYIHYLNDVPMVVKRGDLMMITPQDTHQFVAKNGTSSQHINFCVVPEKLLQLCNALSENVYRHVIAAEKKPVALTPDLLEFFLSHAAQIRLNELHENCISCNLVTIGECLTLAISTIYKASLAPEQSFPAWFKELLEKINSPEFLSMRVKDVYSLSHYAPSTIVKFFRQYLGETIVSYLTKIKMHHACMLLLSSDLTTLSIASSLSYDSLSAFNHAFKSYTGMSPSEYKKSRKSVIPGEEPQEKKYVTHQYEINNVKISGGGGVTYPKIFPDCKNKKFIGNKALYTTKKAA